jgi:serine/threonine-protein kinase ULK/ATG1/polo-like kinase 4
VREKGVEELLTREVRLLREVAHEHVIACREVLMTANNCYIVTEFCPQGDLAALLAKRGTAAPTQAACPTMKPSPFYWACAEVLPTCTPRE